MSEVVTKEETLVGEPHEKPKTQYNYNSLERLGGELRINTKKEKEKKNIAKYNLGESAPFEDTSRIWDLPTNRKPSSSNEPKLLNEYILNQNENKDKYIHNEDALNAELHRSAKMVLIDSEEPLTARSSLSNDSQATWRFGNEEDRSEMESVTSNATGYSSNILFGAQSAYRRTVKKLKEAKLLLKQASKDEIDVGNAESEYFDQKSVKKWHQDEVELAGEKGVYSDNQKGMDGPKVYSHNYEEYNDQNYWNDSVSANHNYYENNGARGRGPNRDFAHENYWGIDEKTPAIRNRAIRGYNNQHEVSRSYNSVGQRGEGGGSERDKQGVDYTYVSNGYYLKDNGDFVLARGGEDLDERDPRGRRGKEVAMAYPPYFRQQDDGVYRNGHEYRHGDGINSIENRTNAYKYDYARRYMDSYDHHGPRDISTNQNWMHGSEYSIQREKNESSSLFLGYKAHKYVQISSQTRPTESRLGIVDQGNVISDKKTMYYGSGMFSKGVGFYTMLAATAGLSAANPVYSAKAFDRFIALLSVVYSKGENKAIESTALTKFIKAIGFSVLTKIFGQFVSKLCYNDVVEKLKSKHLDNNGAIANFGLGFAALVAKHVGSISEIFVYSILLLREFSGYYLSGVVCFVVASRLVFRWLFYKSVFSSITSNVFSLQKMFFDTDSEQPIFKTEAENGGERGHFGMQRDGSTLDTIGGQRNPKDYAMFNYLMTKAPFWYSEFAYLLSKFKLEFYHGYDYRRLETYAMTKVGLLELSSSLYDAFCVKIPPTLLSFGLLSSKTGVMDKRKVVDYKKPHTFRSSIYMLLLIDSLLPITKDITNLLIKP